MNRIKSVAWLALGTIVAVVVLSYSPSVALANTGRTHFGPYDGSSTDSGTCGNDWANDTFKRDFFVKDNGDGTFTLRENFTTGSFLTIAGASPGACQLTGLHGTLVDAGVRGNFHGYLLGVITNGTFNPDATCGDPCTTAGFVANAFGPSAAYSCASGPGDCTFDFDYHANGAQGLTFKHWTNASADVGGNTGDIASQ